MAPPTLTQRAVPLKSSTSRIMAYGAALSGTRRTPMAHGSWLSPSHANARLTTTARAIDPNSSTVSIRARVG